MILYVRQIANLHFNGDEVKAVRALEKRYEIVNGAIKVKKRGSHGKVRLQNQQRPLYK